MKKLMKNKKGFTIVELVIVIAVIAILAAVLIPTFAGVIEKANESAVMQKAAAKYKEAYALDLADGTLDGKEGDSSITDSGYSVTNGVASYTYTEKGFTATFGGEADAKWVVTKADANQGE